MLWDEIDVEGAVPNEEIAARIAEALGLGRDEVDACDDLRARPSEGGVEVLVEATRSRGQFPLRIGIYFIGKKGPPKDRAPAQDAVARSLGLRVLVSDGGDDPYRRTAIDPDGHRTNVNLDVEALDARNELRLSSRFVLRSSDGLEVTLDARRPLVVGRASPDGLQVNDFKLSKRHFELRCAGGAWMVEDLQSASGTYVNEELVRGPRGLDRGDQIRAGGTTFTLV